MVIRGLLNIKYHVKSVIIRFVELYHQDNTLGIATVYDENEIKQLLANNSKSTVKNIEKIKCSLDCKYKWVGGVYYKECFYGIACGCTSVLRMNIKTFKIEYIGELGTSSFKWSGGCVYKDKIYGFMRSANKLLCIDPNLNTIEQIELGLSYSGEHHYGGILAKNGCIYQPPRNTNHILVTNLNNNETHKIMLCSEKLSIEFRYCGGVLHNNGFIYIFPEKNGKVIMLDPLTEKFSFIGSRINSMVFDAAIAPDGNIYGFSAYEKGILKIDVKTQHTKMICTDMGVPGCFGTKLGINGKLYGVPGDGNVLWQFDVATQQVAEIAKIDELGEAKCAGGIVTEDGSIFCVPAFGEYIYRITFKDVKNFISDELMHSKYFTDTY